MPKDLKLSMLMDFYGQLLTEKQLDAMELYYNEDLSLAEIAEDLGITRQGVRDSIKRGEKQLFDFEVKLGLCEKFTNLTSKFDKIFEEAEYINSAQNSSEIGKSVVKIQEYIMEVKKLI